MVVVPVPRERALVALLAGYSLAWFAALISRGGTSWHFFAQGAQLLIDEDDRIRGGLHLYAAAPVLQIGPVALLAALIAMPAGAAGALLIWQVLGALGGLLMLWEIRQIAVLTRPDLDRDRLNARILAAGAFVLPLWLFLAVGVAHLDDELALLFTVLALRAVLSGRTVAAGVLIGLAVDAKPWALPFLVLLLLGRRRRVLALLVGGAVIAVAWLPFFLADPATTNALHYTIPNTPLSALRVIGVEDPRTPSWARPAQALLGSALGVVAIARRRWPAVVLLAIGARIVLDPGTNKYYIAGLIVGAALWDVLGSRWQWPWWTAATYLALFVSRWLPLPPSVHGWLTLAYFLACCALVGPKIVRTS